MRVWAAMRKSRTVTGLDIGSSKICAVEAALDEMGRTRVIAVHSVPSKGVSRGAIVELDSSIDAVSSALGGLKEKTRRTPERIYANVSGCTLEAQSSEGMVRLSLRGREITRRDMSKCVEAASTIKLPYHRDILHKEVKTFYVDDTTEAKNPLGLYGSRLTAKIFSLTVNAAHLLNIQKVVNSAGYQVREFIFSGLADAAAVLEPEAYRKNIVLLDIGASLTELSFFSRGILSSAVVFPFGGADMANPADDDERFVAMKTAMKEHFAQLQKEEAITEVIATGGFSLLGEMIESIEKEIGFSIAIATAREITGNISSDDTLMATTSLGLAKYALGKHSSFPPAPQGHITKRVLSGITEVFARYF